jgi:hypothetical protein
MVKKIREFTSFKNHFFWHWKAFSWALYHLMDLWYNGRNSPEQPAVKSRKEDTYVPLFTADAK